MDGQPIFDRERAVAAVKSGAVVARLRCSSEWALATATVGAELASEPGSVAGGQMGPTAEGHCKRACCLVAGAHQGKALCPVPIESERRLDLFNLTRFLHANRDPPRINCGAGFCWKTLWRGPGAGLSSNLSEQSPKVDCRAVWNVVHDDKLSFKKTVVVSERDRPESRTAGVWRRCYQRSHRV